MSDIPTGTIVRALREISADIYGTDPKPAKAVAAAATRLEELEREIERLQHNERQREIETAKRAEERRMSKRHK
jgi:proteasome assembly chaperone (PAC2) family protein